MKVSLSIIVPVYNTSKFLDRCFTSVFKNETTFHYEVIAVDDCSTDNSLELLNKIKDNKPENCSFKVIHLEQNQGVQNARFVGLDNASGEFVYFVDSDDELSPDCIEEIISTMRKDNLDILYNNILLIDGSEQYSLISKDDFKRALEYGSHLESLLFGAFGYLPSHPFRKSLLEKVDRALMPKLRIMEDLNYLIEISRFSPTKIGVLDKNIYFYYQSKNWHIEKMNALQAEDSLYVISKRYNEIKESYPEHLELFKKANLNTCLRLIHAVKKSENFEPNEKKELLKKIKSEESVSECINISFKQFMKLGMKDKIRYVLYK